MTSTRVGLDILTVSYEKPIWLSDSAYVFVGGLPYDLTEGDVITIFSQYVLPLPLSFHTLPPVRRRFTHVGC